MRGASGAAILILLTVLAGCRERPPAADRPDAAAEPVASTAGQIRRVLEEEARGGDPGAMLELALFLQRAGDRAASVAALKVLVRRHPRFARGRHFLGVAYLSAGRAGDALREFDAETRLTPRDVEARVHVGMALQALGRPDLAAVQYRLAQQTDPEAATPYFALAQLDNGPGGYPRALQLLDQHLARTGRPAPAYHLMSKIYAHTGQRDRALDYARRAVQADPEMPAYWHYLGRIYHEMSEPDLLPAALRCYDRALRMRPADGEIWFDLGRAYSAAHRWDEAIEALRRSGQLAPQNGDVHYHLGQALRSAGRMEEANRELAAYRRFSEFTRRSKTLQKAVSRRPRDPEPRLRLAELCLEFGQHRAARSAAREALSLSGTSKAVRSRAQQYLIRARTAFASTNPAAQGVP